MAQQGNHHQSACRVCSDRVTLRVQVRMTPGRMVLVRNFLGDHHNRVLVVRVGMRESSSSKERPTLSGPSAGGSRKRAHADQRHDVAPVAHNPAVAISSDLMHSIMSTLEECCDMDAVEPCDRHRLLRVLYHVTASDANLPVLNVGPVRCDASGVYIVTCSGFVSVVDFDELYKHLIARASGDEALRTLVRVAYNPDQGALDLWISSSSSRDSGQGKRRRADDNVDDQLL